MQKLLVNILIFATVGQGQFYKRYFLRKTKSTQNTKDNKEMTKLFKVKVETEEKTAKERLTEEIYTVYGVIRDPKSNYTFFIILNKNKFEAYDYSRFAPIKSDITNDLFKVRVISKDKSVKERLPEDIYTVYGVFKEDYKKDIFFLIWNIDSWEWHSASNFRPIN